MHVHRWSNAAYIDRCNSIRACPPLIQTNGPRHHLDSEWATLNSLLDFAMPVFVLRPILLSKNSKFEARNWIPLHIPTHRNAHSGRHRYSISVIDSLQLCFCGGVLDISSSIDVQCIFSWASTQIFSKPLALWNRGATDTIHTRYGFIAMQTGEPVRRSAFI